MNHSPVSVPLLALALVVSAPTSRARADDPSTLASPDTPTIPAPPLDTHFELSVGVSPQVALGGVAGLGNLGALGLAPSIDVGVAIDRRVAVITGASLMAYEPGLGGEYFSIRAPLLVQVYLDEPRVGALVPTLRAGVVGSATSSDGQTVYGGGVRASGGVTWLADRALALRLEVGGTLDATYADWLGSVWLSGALDARASVVLRL
jgi:hypothetical protein